MSTVATKVCYYLKSLNLDHNNASKCFDKNINFDLFIVLIFKSYCCLFAIAIEIGDVQLEIIYKYKDE